MTESNFNSVDETDAGYGQLFSVLMRRRFWVVGVFLCAFSVAIVATLTAEPTYESSMQLLVEPNYQGKKGQSVAESQFADSNVEVDTATQLNLMRSSQLIQKAVDLLHPDYPDISIEEIKKNLSVTQVQEGKVTTNIFEAAYIANDEVKTQKVLKAMQKVYQDYNREQQQQRLAKGLAFIDTQLPEVRQSVVQSEAALEKFRKSQNLIEPEVQAKALTDAMSSIEQEQQKIRAQYEDAQARYIALQQQVARSPQSSQDVVISSRLSESSRYQALLNEIQKIELTIAQERQRFTDTSPLIQQLLAQRESQLALLQQEMKRVLGEDAAQLNGAGEPLLTKGQLGKIDLDLAGKILEAETSLRGLKAQQESLAQKQQQIRAELNRFPSLLAEYNRLQPDIQIKRNTLDQLLKARQELALEIARGGFDWQVVEEPLVGWQTGPNTKQNLLLGVVVGFMLGGVAAFAREMVDDAVHTSEELKKQVDLPLLGMTPEVPEFKASETLIKLPFRKPQVLAPATLQVIDWQPFREAMDLIYQNIQLLNSTCSFNSLLVTSALAGEGKSTLALGLAISAARLHQRVLLIDADLRRPSLHKQLNLPNDRGLSTLLADDATVPIEGIQPSDIYPNISILTSGPTPTDPAKLLSSQRMGQLMAAFQQSYDLVLLDAPPVLGMVDTLIAASFCSGVLMVGRIGQVTRSELTQAIAMLSKLNAVGVIANGAKSPINSYQSYEKKT